MTQWPAVNTAVKADRIYVKSIELSQRFDRDRHDACAEPTVAAAPEPAGAGHRRAHVARAPPTPTSRRGRGGSASSRWSSSSASPASTRSCRPTSASRRCSTSRCGRWSRSGVTMTDAAVPADRGEAGAAPPITAAHRPGRRAAADGARSSPASLFAVFNAVLGGDATFKQVFAVVSHSGVVLAPGAALHDCRSPTRARRCRAPTNLAVFLPFLDEASFPAGCSDRSICSSSGGWSAWRSARRPVPAGARANCDHDARRLRGDRARRRRRAGPLLAGA